MFTPIGTSMHSKDAEIFDRHYISRDAHVCASSGHVVFLDLNSGRYLNLQQRAANALSRHVVGWPVAESSTNDDGLNSEQTRKLLDQLTRRGLLTTDVGAYEDKPQVVVAPPTATMLDTIYMQQPVIRARHVSSFLTCAYKARVYLHWRGIKRVVARARRQVARISAASGHYDMERTRSLTAIFHRLQPLALDAQDGCLLQSFAQREFLLAHGIVAQWVFGVRAVPFSAHCWLQLGNVVLNDVPQRAGYLSPILVV